MFNGKMTYGEIRKDGNVQYVTSKGVDTDGTKSLEA